MKPSNRITSKEHSRLREILVERGCWATDETDAEQAQILERVKALKQKFQEKSGKLN